MIDDGTLSLLLGVSITGAATLWGLFPYNHSLSRLVIIKQSIQNRIIGFPFMTSEVYSLFGSI